MKTFEEAFNTVVITEPADVPAERVCQIVQQMKARREKIAAIFQEIDANEKLGRGLELIYGVSCCAKHAMLNAFKLGLQVGMEMERSETGGVAIE